MSSGSVTALDNVSLNVSRGEFLAITGTSGSGKSTLMNILGCLDKPTDGSYLLNGRDVLALPRRLLPQIRSKEIGFIFQGFNLLDKMTALENVELPMMYAKTPLKQRRRDALLALERVGLSGRTTHLPCELSGGQQQRVAIARAITRKPPLILADEPTGNLDRNSSEEILAILSGLHRDGTTIVLITHDAQVAQRADRVIEIHDGKIIQ